MTTLCAVHPSVVALGPCDRCGTFGCEVCLTLAGEQRLCSPCIARTGAGLPSLEGRALWAKLGLYATGGTHVLGAVIELGVSTKDGAGALLLGLWALASFPVMITTIVLFCRWFHLSARYAINRGVTLPSTPAGAVGSWFIPFVNLVRPFDLTRQMLSGFGGNAGVVGRWQALYIVGNITSNISSRFDNAAFSLIAGLLLLGAALAAVSVINETTRAAKTVGSAS